MIEKIGIGIDLASIEDFKKIPYPKKPNFYKGIFLPSEIKYCLKYKNPYEHFAGKFALKEAVKKAINEQIPMLDIETFYSDSKPAVQLRGKLNKKYRFIASVSHEKNIAVGIIISEKNQIKKELSA